MYLKSIHSKLKRWNTDELDANERLQYKDKKKKMIITIITIIMCKCKVQFQERKYVPQMITDIISSQFTSPYIHYYTYIIILGGRGIVESRSSVRPTVPPSVCPPKFYPVHNFQTIKAINLKLHTLIEHIMKKWNAKEP